MVKRGSLKVFLGAAPGVGKTYAMLEEGHRLRSEGRDVVVGFVEPHGRADTTAMIGDLETIPRRSIAYRGTEFEEMDLAAVLNRHPDIALVDELAHTNIPGSHHVKRWQDVQELLEAGIDVLSTVNIQHLESLNDVIFEITDVVQRETIPDEIVRRADEIELVDLTQEGVRERLAAGKIYPAERVDAALANYFRPGNLGALRELALSWTADRVDEAVSKYRDLHGIERPWETKERVVVAVAGAPGGEAVIRRAARLAMRSRADLIGVYVRLTEGLADDPGPDLAAQKELVRQLGGRYHEVIGEDVGKTLAAFAREEGATQIVLGASRRSRMDELLRGSPIARVVREAGPVDVHVISYEGARRRERRPRRSPRAPLARSRRLAAWALALAGPPAVTWIMRIVGPPLQLHSALLIYLLVAVSVGGIGGALPAVAAAVAGFLLGNWFFTPPVGTWTIGDAADLISLFVFLGVSVGVGLLVGQSSRRNAQARRARAQAEALAATGDVGATGLEDQRVDLLQRMAETLSIGAVSLLRQTAAGWETVAWTGSQELKSPAEGTETIEVGDDLTLAIANGSLTPEDRSVLKGFATQIVRLMETEQLKREVRSAESMAETDRLRTALLGAVSHDLRTPLATIEASLTSLLQPGVDWSEADTHSFLEVALNETARLNRLVGRLLDASRVQAGAVHVFFRPVGLGEVVDSSLAGLRPDRRRVVVEVPETLPDIQTDPDLLERVVANLIDNALTWSPLESPVRITAGEVSGRIDLRIADQGPGIPIEDREDAFQPFRRLDGSNRRSGVGLGLAVARGLLEAMGNELLVEDTPGGGTTMVISFKPAQPVPPRGASAAAN